MRQSARTNVPHLIDMEQLPDYPEELVDVKMAADYFTLFYHDRWLNSEMHLTAAMDVQGAAMNLFFISRKQNPIGSLPDNDAMLAKLLHIDLAVWMDLRGRTINPLRGWEHYAVGNVVVLGHPVVIEVARDALTKREAREVQSEEKAVYARRKRLVDIMRAMKVSAEILNDALLIGLIDTWLLEHHKGQRRSPQIEASISRALTHGYKEGWFKR